METKTKMQAKNEYEDENENEFAMIKKALASKGAPFIASFHSSCALLVQKQNQQIEKIPQKVNHQIATFRLGPGGGLYRQMMVSGLALR